MSNDPGARVALLETMKALRSVQEALTVLRRQQPFAVDGRFDVHMQQCNDSLEKALNALGASSDE